MLRDGNHSYYTILVPEYMVSPSEPIHALAYNRVNEKRSVIGSTAVNVVKRHLETLQGSAVRDWLVWASRADGPLFFKEPVAPDSPLDRKHPEYTNPSGRLLSKFLIDVLTPALRWRVGSVSSSGYPRGLVALSMAALERAVHIHLRPDGKTNEFRSGIWGSKVVSYYSSLGSVDERRWKELLDACGIDSAQSPEEEMVPDDEYRANLSFTDSNRAFIFDFSSPVKS
ncbi:hypothetical protein CPC08DRAFT_730402 [Agrocybe pediades]|nr:hypothetical protein CPC08DRAFT_730402 [Agrocybe pediades]